MKGTRLPYHLQHHGKTTRKGAARKANGLLLPGVVVAVYRPGERPDRYAQESAIMGVLCDVQVMSARRRTILRDVPLMSGSAGLNDHEVSMPRAAGATLNGGSYSLDGGGDPGQVTAGHDMDGDWVMVGFLDDDLDKPVIVGQLPHPKTNRRPSSNAETLYRWRRYLRGVSLGVLEDGSVEVDLSQASAGTTDASGAEQPDGVPNLTIRTQDDTALEIQPDLVRVTTADDVTVEIGGGKIVFALPGGETITLEAGKITAEVSGGQKLELSSAGAILDGLTVAIGGSGGQPMLKSTTFLTALAAFLTTMTTSVPTSAGACATLASALPTCVSLTNTNT